MGTCATVCSNPNKKQAEVNIESLQNDKFKNKNTHQLLIQPNYSKLIYLQTRIKRFLKKKKKNGIMPKDQDLNTKNINVNINLNVNMDRPTNENTRMGTKDNSKQVKNISKDNNSNQLKKLPQNINPSNENSKSINQDSSIMIPTVKAELKESLIFSHDPFIKGKKSQRNINDSKDPRYGPFDDKRHKYPKIFEDESSYEGEWKNGKRDGLGILCWKDVSKFIGEFIEDKVLGFGKLIHEDGDIYTGYWNDFQAQGIGYYKTKKEASYEGYWKDDKQNGFGIEKWPRGSNYLGEYIDGNKEGFGILNFEGNGGYEGEFQGGSISGVGTFFFKDNRKYEGEWKNNKMHGYGIITWPDGKFYEGEFFEDKKEGFGVFYSHRKIYMGLWKNSLLEGDTIIIENGRMKKQFWENGRVSKNLPLDTPIFFEKFVDEIIKYKANFGSPMKNHHQ